MFYDNFEKLCRENGKTPVGVARELGISRGSPSNWKQNGNIPHAPTLQKIADYFGITTDQLLNGLPEPSRLHREKGEKIAVLASVGAGIPLEAINTFDESDPDSWEEISKLDAQSGRFFALRVRGDSMEPMINYGDIVIVRIEEEYHDMDFVVALINGDEGVCKQLEYRNHGIALISMNPKYPPMEFTNEQIQNYPVRIAGRIVEIRRKVGR